MDENKRAISPGMLHDVLILTHIDLIELDPSALPGPSKAALIARTAPSVDQQFGCIVDAELGGGQSDDNGQSPTRGQRRERAALHIDGALDPVRDFGLARELAEDEVQDIVGSRTDEVAGGDGFDDCLELRRSLDAFGPEVVMSFRETSV